MSDAVSTASLGLIYSEDENMDKKKALITMVSALFLSAFIAFSIPFVGSMQPSASAGQGLLYVDISGMQLGMYKVVDDPIERATDWSRKLLIIRDYNGQFYAHTVPFYQGRYVLPDGAWQRKWGGFCTRFHPDMEGDRIRINGEVHCHDEEDLLWIEKHAKWSYDGSSNWDYMEDMQMLETHIDGKYLVIHNSRPW